MNTTNKLGNSPTKYNNNFWNSQSFSKLLYNIISNIVDNSKRKTKI